MLYVDIDVHHGDGVEEAFYTTDRVMTCSFHKYGEFFPGTGDVRDTGIGKGKGYAVNVPLRDGMSDANYASIFEPVITRIIEWYKPGAIVLQCGSDSLSGDRLGSFNLSMRGHAACVQFIKGFGLPLLMLGGGGYTVKSVSRTWAYETGLAAGVELGSSIPNNEYYEYYGPDYELDVKPNNMADHNTREYLDKVRESVFEMLRDKNAAPSVPLQAIPKLRHDDESDNEAEDDEDPDERRPMRLWDREKQNENSLSDSEDEGLGGRKHRQSHRDREGSAGKLRRRSRSPRTAPASQQDKDKEKVKEKEKENKDTEQLGVQTETTSADIKKWAATVEQARDGDVEMKSDEKEAKGGEKEKEAERTKEEEGEKREGGERAREGEKEKEAEGIPDEPPAHGTTATPAVEPTTAADKPAEPSQPAASTGITPPAAAAEKKDESEPMDTDPR